ncbi:hypothetical protein Cma02nite_28230 [Cellulomonas marina]|nr:hypothetical protein Cma02nite_28230 [Cellulomonas marina]
MPALDLHDAQPHVRPGDERVDLPLIGPVEQQQVHEHHDVVGELVAQGLPDDTLSAAASRVRFWVSRNKVRHQRLMLDEDVITGSSEHADPRFRTDSRGSDRSSPASAALSTATSLVDELRTRRDAPAVGLEAAVRLRAGARSCAGRFPARDERGHIPTCADGASHLDLGEVR